MLKEAGLPTVEEYIVHAEKDCVEGAGRIGYPVVLKGLEERRIHKSEAGLLRLDIRDENCLIQSFHELKGKMAPASAVLLQRQMRGQLELILGYLRDPQSGPCVMIGLGGILTDILADTAFALAPLTHGKAIQLIRNLKNQQLLNGIRGIPPAPVEEIARYLVILGNLGMAFPSIREIDINPLILTESGPVIVDATMILD
jgi:acetate---CoA ligase (ADP-forming)